VLKDERLLEAAKSGADFIGSERNGDKNDENFGLIYAFESAENIINTSAILECLDGLIVLSEATGKDKYRNWTEDAVSWIAEKAFIEGEGLFRDNFSATSLQFERPDWYDHPHFAGIKGDMPGRPLLDDGIFLKIYQKIGNKKYRSIFYETAERLLREENPPGNWVNIVPAAGGSGPIHPRHAYWWGLPMIFAYKDSKENKYLECASRSGQWYINAQRADGGLIRNTYTNFNTDSFGHATSGIACAVILWEELREITGDERWIKPIEKALKYCMSMQFINPNDSNLRGAILEKILPPDGTDCSPYYIRDLGTIFFIQAASKILNILYE
jgi:hypothetical protein